MNSQSKFSATLVQLVTFAKYHAAEIMRTTEAATSSMSTAHIIEEFLTLKIKAPRRAGSSTAALKLLDFYTDALIVVPNSNFRRLYAADERIQKRIVTVETLETRTASLRPSLVILDPASHFNLEQKMVVTRRFGISTFYLLVS